MERRHVHGFFSRRGYCLFGSSSLVRLADFRSNLAESNFRAMVWNRIALVSLLLVVPAAGQCDEGTAAPPKASSHISTVTSTSAAELLVRGTRSHSHVAQTLAALSLGSDLWVAPTPTSM